MPEDQGELNQKLKESSLNLYFISACWPFLRAGRRPARVGMNFSMKETTRDSGNAGVFFGFILGGLLTSLLPEQT
jgi:hypothetical protein